MLGVRGAACGARGGARWFDLCGVPAAAHGLDQRHAGDELAAVQLRQAALGTKSQGLGGDDVQVDAGAGAVLGQRQALGQLRGSHRLFLCRGFVVQNAQHRQIVFDFLEAG